MEFFLVARRRYWALVPLFLIMINGYSQEENAFGAIFGPSHGLFDNGFYQDAYRTELGNTNTITIGECLYPTLDDPSIGQIVTDAFCPSNGDTNYLVANYYSNRYYPGLYWVIENNNEPSAFSNKCNLGPPNQSLPMGTSVYHNEVINFQINNLGPSGRKRIYFALKNRFNPCGGESIPYTSITAHKNRGNGGVPVAYFRLNAQNILAEEVDRSILQFNAAIIKCVDPFPCLLYLQLYSFWAQKPRILILTFGKINHHGSHGRHVHWNWPVKESMHYPGADIAYLRCSSSSIPCVEVSEDGKKLSLSMAELWLKASNMQLFDDPIPTGISVPINGLGIAMETTGEEGEIHTFVDGIQVSEGRNLEISVGSGWNKARSEEVELTLADNLVAMVTGTSWQEAESCLEVMGRVEGERNGENSCGDLANWVKINEQENGLWWYQYGVWRLEIAPASSIFPPGHYRFFWRNSTNGKLAMAQFKIRRE